MKRFLLVATQLLISVFMVFGQNESNQSAELPPGWWLIPKTSTKIKLGGYVKLDVIHDFDPIGSPNFFDVSAIPTDGSKGTSTHLNARETRLHLDTRTPTKVGELRTYVEGDFYGSSGAFRLRHAFVEIDGKLLAGQYWSNYMDESIIPSTLDFEKPAAYVFARHAMVRWKHELTDDSYLAIAIEEPNANAQSPGQPGDFESPLPDLTARYRLTKDWGHFQVSGFAATLRYRFDAGGKDDLSLFGINLSGQLFTNEKDNLIYQVVYGPGVGRFRGGLSAGLDENGNLESISDLGITVGFQHFWTPDISSLVVFNHGSNDNTAGQPGTDVSQLNYFAANVIWHFIENGLVGIEYLRGEREDVSENDGIANRLQFSVKYSFN